MKLVRYAHNPVLEANPERDWESGAVFNCGATFSGAGNRVALASTENLHIFVF